jgi:eukaryotic-like serine/threonine-protein kinase
MVTTPPPDALLFINEVAGGRFEIQRFIAPGGFGYVFEAFDRQSNEQVAIKILKFGVPASAALEFEGERDIVEMLDGCSCIVRGLGSGQHDMTITSATGASAVITASYLALELADACLAELVVQRQNLSWEDRLRLFRGVVKGVHQMHLQKVVHRDLKSENVLLFSDKGLVSSKLSDFGRSRILTRRARFGVDDYAPGRGDLRFAPPEVLWLLGVDTERFWTDVDLYHLGSVLFELGTGQGITSIAIGNPNGVLQHVKNMTPSQRTRGFAASLPALKTRFEFAFSLFKQEVPPAIRDEALRLLAQLCDPDAARREPRRLLSGRGGPDLQWLIRRVDILILLLTAKPRRRSYRRKAV